VCAQFVVVVVFVFPLVVRLHIEHFHESADFNIGEVVTQACVRLVTDEVAVARFNVWDGVFFRPGGLVVDFGVVFTVVSIIDFFFFFTVATFFIVVAIVIVAFLTVLGFSFFWWVRVAILHNALIGGTSVAEWSLFNGFDTHELIRLRVFFFLVIF